MPSILAGGVVVRKDMVVVVEALPYSSESHSQVLHRVDVLVVRLVAPHVGSAVDQPGGVQAQGVAQDGGQEVGIPQALPPEVPRHHSWYHKAAEHHQRLVNPRSKF